MVLDVVPPEAAARYSRLTVAEPLALVPAGGGCDLMPHRPRYSMLEALQEHNMLCFWLLLRGQRIKKINKLLISANFRGQRIAKRELRSRFRVILYLCSRRIVR